MQCRNCGTEIADKAIVCYRCGTATTDPVRRKVPIRARRNPMAAYVAAVVMLLLALYLGQTSRTAADPNPLQLVAGALAGAAIVILLIRFIRRR
jgi:ABC-type Fe3+-siderophore transport system permease subunit